MPPQDKMTKLIKDAAEQLTGGLKEINTDHALIHDGYGMAFQIALASMTTGQVLNYSFKTAAGKYPHLKNIKLQSIGASIKVELIDGITITADEGTAVPIVNQNRNSSIVAGSTIKAAPTFEGTEEVFKTIYALADATNQSSGIADIVENSNQEMVLEPEHSYLIRITNLVADTIGRVVVTGFFYEETGGLSG